MTKRTTYRITTVHPTGYRDGTYEVMVSTDAKGLKNVSGGGFGCSRDYDTKSDKQAIVNLLTENCMRLAHIEKVN